MRILVSGGNGYVGRYLTRLLYADHDVAVIDNLRYGELRFDPDELERFRLDVVDITDADATAAVVADFDPEVIVHLAAIHYIPECEQRPGLTMSTNVAGTVNLLVAAPDGCRFVFASSGAVYAPSDEPHDEVTSPAVPTDIYGWSKLQGEQLVHHVAGQRSLPAVIVRLFNAVGPGETNPHLFPEVVAQLVAGQRSISLGNLSSRRDYVHVEDIADGLAAVALAGEVGAGEVVTVNLGTSLDHSADEILDRVRKVSAIDFEVVTDPGRLRPVDRPLLVARNERIAERFGWSPARDVDEAVAALWEHPDLPAAMVDKYRS